MKKNHLLLFILVIAGYTSLAQDAMVQDTTIINRTWRDLVGALKSKTSAVLRLTRSLNGTGNVDRKQLNTSATYARDLAKFMDTLIHNDSITINKLDLLNNNLTEAFSRTVATLQSNPQLTNKDSYMKTINQLANIDSRIVYTKKTYNDTCLQFNRSDLIFGKAEDSGSP